jgi:hypothetical protein
MHIDPNVKTIGLTVLFGGLAYYLNETLDKIPEIKPIVKVIIIVICAIIILMAGIRLLEAL